MNRAFRMHGAPTVGGMEGGYNLGAARAPASGRGPKATSLVAFALLSLLLAGLVIMNLGRFGEPGGITKPSKVSADLLAYKEALSSYELQTGALPTTEQGLQVLWEKPSIPPVPDEWQKIMTGEILDPWGNPYQYRNPGRHNPKGYDVFSMGPDGVAGTLDDIGNWPRLNNHGTP